MRRALTISLALHLALGAVLTLGLVRPRALPVEETVTVELVAAPEAGPTATAPAAPAEAAPLPPREAAAPVPRPEPPPEEPPPQPQQAAPPPPAEQPPPPKPAPPMPAPEPQLAAPPVRPEPAKPPPPRPQPAKVEPAKEETRPAEKPAADRPPPPKPRPAEPPRPVETAAKPPAKPEPAKPEPDKPQPAKPAQEDSFAALLRSVERLERRVQADQASPGRGRAEPQAAEARGAAPRADQALTQGEIEAIRRQIERCWNVPVGVRGIETMQVRLRIAMNRDGSVARVGIEDQARMLADPAFRTVAESAQRAVLTCQLVLPAEKYDQWREMVMTFHPKDALSG